MRALILISGLAIAAASCGERPSGEDLDANGVVDVCELGPGSAACHRAQAEDACSESDNKPACVADYINNVPVEPPVRVKRLRAPPSET